MEHFARSTLTDPAFAGVAPISLVRARALALNPLADPEDIALAVAFHRERCIGYHGVLPGYLNIAADRSKVYWLVTFYLDPDFRGRGCGKKLVNEIQKTGVDLVATGITRGAEWVYRSLGFTELGELSYGQLRLDRLHLTSAHKGGAGKQGMLRHIDEWWYRLAKKGMYAFLCRKAKPPRHLQAAASGWPPSAGPDTWPGQSGREGSFDRGSATIGWMLRHPWIVPRTDGREDVNNYYFSRVRDLFEFVFLEISDHTGESNRGFVILSLSGNKNSTVIKILDYRVPRDDDLFLVGYLALDHARQVAADRIEYPASLNDFFSGHLGVTSLLKNKKRLYLYCPGHAESPLASAADLVRLDYCDSDTPFT